MDALSTAFACLLCAAQPAELPMAVAQWEPIMAAASTRFDVPQTWIAHVMQEESGGRTELDGKPITSSAGAMGLMQIMPETYAGLRQRYGFGADAYNPHDNIFAGTAYLHELYVRYGYPNLFAAYQAGPSRLDDYLRGRPLPSVTTAYVAALIGRRSARITATKTDGEVVSTRSENALFFVNHGGKTPTSFAAASSSLFVSLTTAPR
ncbi:MAG: lytic transglycosylase domain-containing protein [Rhizomicrobium sp.]